MFFNLTSSKRCMISSKKRKIRIRRKRYLRRVISLQRCDIIADEDFIDSNRAVECQKCILSLYYLKKNNVPFKKKKKTEIRRSSILLHFCLVSVFCNSLAFTMEVGISGRYHTRKTRRLILLPKIS